jgi:hypothetical protein
LFGLHIFIVNARAYADMGAYRGTGVKHEK